MVPPKEVIDARLLFVLMIALCPVGVLKWSQLHDGCSGLGTTPTRNPIRESPSWDFDKMLILLQAWDVLFNDIDHEDNILSHASWMSRKLVTKVCLPVNQTPELFVYLRLCCYEAGIAEPDILFNWKLKKMQYAIKIFLNVRTFPLQMSRGVCLANNIMATRLCNKTCSSSQYFSTSNIREILSSLRGFANWCSNFQTLAGDSFSPKTTTSTAELIARREDDFVNIADPAGVHQLIGSEFQSFKQCDMQQIIFLVSGLFLAKSQGYSGVLNACR